MTGIFAIIYVIIEIFVSINHKVKNMTKWTNNEIDTLNKCIDDCKTIEEIGEIFPDRTINAIKSKIFQLGLNIKQKQIKNEKLVGKKFGKLTILYVIDEPGEMKVHCKCECNNECDVDFYRLKNGITKSCGCLKKEAGYLIGKNNIKKNRYDLETQNYGIGWIGNNTFYFDKEDYNLISCYSWHIHKEGYIRTCYNVEIDELGKRHNKYIMIHQLLSNNYFDGQMVDHINGKPYDNRKDNLRVITQINNAKNLKLSKANTSGHKGVYLMPSGKWEATIQSNLTKYSLGTYENFDDAVKAREVAEKELFKEYSRDKDYL